MPEPQLKPSQLVGTDLVQAIPLVAAASVGHMVAGSVDFGIAGSMLIGAIPGTFIGAQISSRAPGGIIRRALAVLLGFRAQAWRRHRHIGVNLQVAEMGLVRARRRGDAGLVGLQAHRAS